MLNRETLDHVKNKIRLINHEKDIEVRLQMMIEAKDDLRWKINDELDELFSTIVLKKSKLNIDE